MSHEDAVKTAGRGALAIGAAKGMFLISGLGLTLIMPRIILDSTGAQDPAQFGRYRVSAQTMSILAQAVLLSVLQVMSKFSAEQRDAAGTLLRALAKVVVPLVILVGIIAQLLTPWIAASLNDPELVPLLRAAFLIPVFYGVYALLLGLVNGSRAFNVQALLDGSFSLLKLACIVAGALLFPRLVSINNGAAVGGLLGWASAAAIITTAAFFATGRLRRDASAERSVNAQAIARFAGGIILYTLTFELLKQVDLLVVKGSASGLAGGQAMVGQYSAAMDFARVPYFIVMGISLVLFPMLSSVAFSGDQDAAKRYIHNATRFTFGLAAVASVGIFVAAPALLPVLFGAAYEPAVPILRWLCAGQMAFALVTIAMNILNASGRPMHAFALVALMAGSASLLVPLGVSHSGVLGAAAASVFALWLGALVSLVFVRRSLGASLAPLTFLRVGLAAVVLGSLALVWQPSGLLQGLAALAIVGLGDLVILVALRELGADDLALVRRVIGRG
ncbi:MAG: oligosaccharide flippase family protein [Myxococcota bacterium]|nr:oligosaccharide flippase family protein [Myxococcota bacterium]